MFAARLGVARLGSAVPDKTRHKIKLERIIK